MWRARSIRRPSFRKCHPVSWARVSLPSASSEASCWPRSDSPCGWPSRRWPAGGGGSARTPGGGSPSPGRGPGSGCRGSRRGCPGCSGSSASARIWAASSSSVASSAAPAAAASREPHRIPGDLGVERRDLVPEQGVELVEEPEHLRRALKVAAQPVEVVGKPARRALRAMVAGRRLGSGRSRACPEGPDGEHPGVLGRAARCRETIASAPVGSKRVRPPGMTR
jgi:hypothetical protein